jgi:hypothetical protein
VNVNKEYLGIELHPVNVNKEYLGIELHSVNVNKEDSISLSRPWKPLVHTLKECKMSVLKDNRFSYKGPSFYSLFDPEDSCLLPLPFLACKRAVSCCLHFCSLQRDRCYSSIHSLLKQTFNYFFCALWKKLFFVQCPVDGSYPSLRVLWEGRVTLLSRPCARAVVTVPSVFCKRKLLPFCVFKRALLLFLPPLPMGPILHFTIHGFH